MSNRDLAVSVRGLSKSYAIAHNAPKHTTMAEALVHTFKKRRPRAESETFWALKDIDFDIKKGEVVGIIGRNGAGKSTLLKVLSRITEPTSGQIDLYGRVGSLLEVGTGFHPELTGRENIYMNGSILGMTKREITKHFDDIVEFAEVEQFLDTPVKRYSSGMYVRLAFAVAAHLNPEILIVDEVLSVGDAEFQKKCLGKMQDVAQQEGRTVLFVSHNMTAVQALCNQCIFMRNGHVELFSDVAEVIPLYQTMSQGSGVQTTRGIYDLADRINKYEAERIVITKAAICNGNGEHMDAILMGEPFSMKIEVAGLSRYREAILGVRINSASDQLLADVNTGMKPPQYQLQRQNDEQFVLKFDYFPFTPGIYRIGIAAAQPGIGILDYVEHAFDLHILENDVYGSGYQVHSGHGIVYLKAEWEVNVTHRQGYGNLSEQLAAAIN